MTKRQEFVENVKKEVTNNSIYVWGGQGELLEQLTLSKIESMEGNDPKQVERILKTVSKKYPDGMKKSRCFDCSGLITYHLIKLGLLMFDTTADGLYRKCKPITKRELLPGDLVFTVKNNKATHVAMVSEVNGDVIKLVEAVGRDVGIAETALTTKFNKYGRFPNF